MEWVDGTPVGFTYFRPGEPNGESGDDDCVQARTVSVWLCRNQYMCVRTCVRVCLSVCLSVFMVTSSCAFVAIWHAVAYMF